MTSRKRLMQRMTIFRSSAVVVAWITAAAFPVAAVAQAAPPETHTVKPGDTLWDLAQQYLNDPFLWPQIYRLNTAVVEDPHWIYPGEVLLITGTEVAAVPSTETPVPPTEGQGEAQAPTEAAGGGAEAAQEDSVTPEAMNEALAENEALETPSVEGNDSPTYGGDDIDMTALFGKPGVAYSITGAAAPLYKPLLIGEFYSSGWLSEGQKLPAGQMVGFYVPSQVAVIQPRATALLFTKIIITPPKGATYQVGDTLRTVRLGANLENYGVVIIPTALIQVIDVSKPENVAQVINQFDEVRDDQLVLPLEHFVDPGEVHPVPISDGVVGEVVFWQELRRLQDPLKVIFINKGRKDGVAPGDMFELIRPNVPGREDASGSVPGPIGTLQIVRVGDRTASAVIVTVSEPRIPIGTPVRQVAKLPT